ncbi:hypothetical protein [Sphingobium olei]|uniref:Uncharacterized protein n=1 Tax=Sphingobium olei TaxID=420955 RepID=A0ABW3P7N2_9SPHN
MYQIHFRHDINLLDIAWHGLFDPETVASYAREVKARFVQERFLPGYLLRMDMSRSAVQPQDAVAAFREHLGEGEISAGIAHRHRDAERHRHIAGPARDDAILSADLRAGRRSAGLAAGTGACVGLIRRGWTRRPDRR